MLFPGRIGHRLEVGEVGAGAEVAPGALEQDHANLPVPPDRLQGLRQGVDRPRVERVSLPGPVQGQDGDRISLPCRQEHGLAHEIGSGTEARTSSGTSSTSRRSAVE